MRDIACFVEDHAHRVVVGAMTQRIAEEQAVDIKLDWRSARRGHGRVVSEFRTYLRDLERQGGALPDLIIISTDANCKGLNERMRELEIVAAPVPVVQAIPDPHVERWLLLDGAAFREVFGRGCNAPDNKCDRDRYKEMLARAILETGIMPSLGGIEFAEDIVAAMDLDRAARGDRSLQRFLDALRRTFRGWQ